MSNVLPLESEIDRELAAMKAAWAILAGLKPDQSMRVLTWLQARAFEEFPPNRRKHFPGGLPGEVLGSL